MNLKLTKKISWLNAKQDKKGFTLIELLVAIAIITILALWATNLDLNRLSNKQKLEIFTNSVKTNYETIRNNSLSWKWIWPNLVVPKKWKIDFSKSNSWTILTSYSMDWTSWTGASSLDFQNNFEISTIRCKDINWTLVWNVLNDTETWSIELEWIKTELGWDSFCDDVSSKIIEIRFWNKINEFKTLEINTLNWLVSTK